MAKRTPEEMWEQMLTGSYPRLHGMRKMWGALPSPPRCKLCNAPFRGPGGVLMRAIAYGPSPLNRRLCKWCIRAVHKHPGGAQTKLTIKLSRKAKRKLAQLSSVRVTLSGTATDAAGNAATLNKRVTLRR